MLRVLRLGPTTYSDLLNHLDPTGAARGRFNYHLKLLREADLVQVEETRYRLTPRGEAALTLLKGVSEDYEPSDKVMENRREGHGRATLVAKVLRSRMGVTLGLVGGIVAVVGSLSPWVTQWYLSIIPLNSLTGLQVGLGGVLTLTFVLIGLLALAFPKVRAVGGAMGVLAMVTAVHTLSAIGTREFYPSLAPGFRYASAEPAYGLFLSLAGAAMLVMGAVWALHDRRLMVTSATTAYARLRDGSVVALAGAGTLLAGTLLPWGTLLEVWVGTHVNTHPGISFVGGILTLAFGLAGLIALVMWRRRAVIVGGLLGAIALICVVLTFVASVGVFPPAMVSGSFGDLRELGGAVGRLEFHLEFGLFISLVGASMLVLGAAWTLRDKSSNLPPSGTDDIEGTASSRWTPEDNRELLQPVAGTAPDPSRPALDSLGLPSGTRQEFLG